MIYLDSAATSLYKPDSVQYAVIEAMATMASPGRGSHIPAMRAADLCFECRENIARLLGVEQPEKIVFTMNATHALNIAISTLAKEGTRVLISGYEHNSVTRPLHAKGVAVTVLDTPIFDQKAFLERLNREIDGCDLVVTTHVSNAFGFVLPIEAIASVCREKNKPLIIDASQSAGVLELDLANLGAAFVAMPGHKGLLGPQGTGVLVCKNEAKPVLYGGSGSESASPLMPEYLPDRLEAGTHNVTGIAGLNAGVKYLLKNTISAVREHERQLLNTFCESFEGFFAAKLFKSETAAAQCSALSLVPSGITPEALAERLGSAGISIRSGLHCAPTAHKTAGTFETGTARFSVSPFLTTQQVRKAAEITKEIIKNP